MRHFFIIIAGLFIINIVHADVSKKDLEALHALIQENKPLAEIEASDVWKKLATPTEEDIRAMREFPKVAAEQQPFMAFHNRDMMDIIRYLSQEIQKCEEQGNYDHEIALMDTLYSFYRLHILNAVAMGLIICAFRAIGSQSVINAVNTIAGYTYGPLLGLYSFGLFVKNRRPIDKMVPYIAIASPILSYLLNMYSTQLFNGYQFGFEILIINGLITFIALMVFSKHDIKTSEI